MPKIQPNNADNIAKCTQRLIGIEKHVTDPKTTIDIDGKTYTLAQLRAIYQDELDVRAEIHQQMALLKALLTKRARVHAQRLAADRALKPWVLNKFGVKSAKPLEFGFPPAKVTLLTADQKLRAVELRKATREARRTMGKRQKEKIKGVLPAEAAVLRDGGGEEN
jgi:hypothetical protein